MTIEPYNYNDEPSGRVDTLVQAIERIERLEKQLNIADSYLQVIVGLKGKLTTPQTLNLTLGGLK